MAHGDFPATHKSIHVNRVTMPATECEVRALSPWFPVGDYSNVTKHKNVKLRDEYKFIATFH